MAIRNHILGLTLIVTAVPRDDCRLVRCDLARRVRASEKYKLSRPNIKGSHSEHSLSRYCLSSPVQHANRERPALGSPPTLPVCFVRRTRFRPDFVGNDDDLIVFDIHSCDNGISMNTMSPSGSRPSYSPPGEHTFNPRAITTDVRQPSDGEKTERARAKVTAAGQQ
ncbi:hypothetical protein QTP88_004403 [Uroleucon formosanum]